MSTGFSPVAFVASLEDILMTLCMGLGVVKARSDMASCKRREAQTTSIHVIEDSSPFIQCVRVSAAS